MTEFSKFVGLDIHQDTIAVAVSEASGGSARYYGKILYTPTVLAKLVKTLTAQGPWSRFAMRQAQVAMGSIGTSRSWSRPMWWWLRPRSPRNPSTA